MKALACFLLFFYGVCAQEVAPPVPKKPRTKPKFLMYPSGIVRNRKKEIILGFSAPLTRGMKELGEDLSLGMDLVFSQINREGGVKGYFLNRLVEDDFYNLHQSYKNVIRFLDKTSIFFGLFGSGKLKVMPPEILKQSLVLFPVAGASLFRQPKYSSVLFYRPSTRREVRALVAYAVKRLYREKVAIFYEDTLWGRDGLEAAKEKLSELGLKPVVVTKYSRNTVNVLQQAKDIAHNIPNVLIGICHSRAMYSLIKESINKGLQNCEFLGVSESMLAQKRLRDARGINLITSSVVPNPWKSDMPIVRDYAKAMERVRRNYSVFSLEGFVMATIFADSLRNTSLPFTKDKIKRKLESLRGVTLKGLPLDFNIGDRSLSSRIWINLGKDKSWPLARDILGSF